MRSNSQILIKKINLSQKIDLSYGKLNNIKCKNAIILKTRCKKLISNKYNKNNSPQNIYHKQYQSLPSKRIISSNQKINNKININNYQYFPKRSLLIKPHFINNTGITLNLFGKNMIDNQQKISILAQSLYKQLSQSRMTYYQKNNQKIDKNNNNIKKSKINNRIQSAPFKRQQSIKFTPWQIQQAHQEIKIQYKK